MTPHPKLCCLVRAARPTPCLDHLRTWVTLRSPTVALQPMRSAKKQFKKSPRLFMMCIPDRVPHDWTVSMRSVGRWGCVYGTRKKKKSHLSCLAQYSSISCPFFLSLFPNSSPSPHLAPCTHIDINSTFDSSVPPPACAFSLPGQFFALAPRPPDESDVNAKRRRPPPHTPRDE